MLSFSKFKRSVLIGLDIQPDHICLLQLTRKRKIPQIVKHAMAQLSAGVIVDGKVVAAEKLTSVIRQLVNETKTHNAMTAIALPSHCVISKSIQLPAALSSIELEAEIHLRLSQYLPGMNDEICFDYHKLHSDQTFQEILLIAAKNQLMTAYVSAVNQAGLRVKIVEVDIYAIARAFYHCVKVPNKIVALLNADSVSANFLVIQEQQIIFSQHIMLSSTLENRVTQLLGFIQAYDAVHRSQTISQVYLSGQLFDEDAIAQVFETALVIPVEILRVTAPKKYSLTSFGLSLRRNIYDRN